MDTFRASTVQVKDVQVVHSMVAYKLTIVRGIPR